MGGNAAVDAGGAAGPSGGAASPEGEVSATLRQLAEQSRLHAGGSGSGDDAGPLDEAMLSRCTHLAPL